MGCGASSKQQNIIEIEKNLQEVSTLTEFESPTIEESKSPRVAEYKSPRIAEFESPRTVDLKSQRIKDVFLIWLDANLDENKEDFKEPLEQLHRVITSIYTFTDTRKCFNFIKKIKTEKLFIIVSSELGPHIVPDIEALPTIHTIYVLFNNEEFREGWTQEFHKIKGIYTNIETICKEFAIDLENCDRSTASISFSGIDTLFLYIQLIKEAFLQIEGNDQKSIKELAEFCRHQDNISAEEIKKIEEEYRDHSPIWWYTGPYFFYSTLNRGLRLMDTDIILKVVFFIRHLHNHIQMLYDEQQSNSSNMNDPFTVYRGQGLLLENFEKMQKTKGGLMSFNNFLLTSLNRQVSLETFARPSASREDSVGILFVITVDPQICRKSAVPFADVRDVGYYKGKEAELLFTTHTIFRIEKIQSLQDKHTDRLWEVNLTLVGNDDHELNNLVSNLREDVGTETGWSRLGYIFIKLGESAKAEHLYKILLENAATDEDRAHYNHQLGWVYENLGEYSITITYYEKSLEYNEKILPPNHPNLAASYNNIGRVYLHMGEYTKALSSYEQALEIRKIALPPNHPDLAGSYKNIGDAYFRMGEYSKTLSSYEQCLEINKIALPANHPDLAASYKNIGILYDNMGEYSKALSSYEKSLEIQKIALPPNHPDLAASYEGIGILYDNMGEYSKALSSYERSLEIKKTTLRPNHPDLADTYENIALVYDSMNEYTKAFPLLQNTLDIRERSLPASHPKIAKAKMIIDCIKQKLM